MYLGVCAAVYITVHVSVRVCVSVHVCAMCQCACVCTHVCMLGVTSLFCSAYIDDIIAFPIKLQYLRTVAIAIAISLSCQECQYVRR